MVELKFKNKETCSCEILGIEKINNRDYMVLFDNSNKEVYVYIYIPAGKKKYRLFPIKDQNEMRAVCSHLAGNIK